MPKQETIQENGLDMCRIDTLRVYGVDETSGECVDVTEDYYLVNRAEEAKRKRQRQQNLKSLAQITARSGVPFVWVICRAVDGLWQSLSSKYIAMLCFLATYQNYKCELATGKKPIYKKGLPQLLGVSRATAYRFWQAIEKAGAGREEADGRLCLNKQYFHRGMLSGQEIARLAEAEWRIVRLYIEPLREMYRGADKNALGHFLQMIPFIHREYNIVCYNPMEPDLELVRSMSMEEICRAIGCGEKNSARLWEGVSELKFRVLEKAECAAIQRVYNRDCGYKLFINPDACYSGMNWEQAHEMGGF
ncbi:MAG: hypothetical protein J6R39_02645 [Oscillospiraceae bacterium]|nr:hypothetical protein [Oscillospiraceae bacterium]